MRLFLFLAVCSICSAQSLSVGVVGGIRATNDVLDGATSESKRYIVGPMVNVGLPLGFEAEFDALYSREGYRAYLSNFAFNQFTRETARSWEFPILLRYRIPLSRFRPFAEIGFAPRTISGTIESTAVVYPNYFATPGTFHNSAPTNWASSKGVVAGGGIQLGFGRLRISPEVRFTHWNNTPIYGQVPDGNGYSLTTQNQVEVLLGFGWRVFSLSRR
jgi:hypothetical protein